MEMAISGHGNGLLCLLKNGQIKYNEHFIDLFQEDATNQVNISRTAGGTGGITITSCMCDIRWL